MLIGLEEPRSYQEILQRNFIQGRDFRIAFGDSNVEKCLLAAPHGCGIEPGTSEIMRAVAELGSWAWYEFAGFLRGGNREALLIPSPAFDEPTFVSLRARAGFCVEFHGSSQAGDPVVYVGGNWERGRTTMTEAINERCEDHGIKAIDAMTQISGLQPTGAKSGGPGDIKLEFSKEARSLLFPPDASREARGRRSARLKPLSRSIHAVLQRLCAAAANR